MSSIATSACCRTVKNLSEISSPVQDRLLATTQRRIDPLAQLWHGQRRMRRTLRTFSFLLQSAGVPGPFFDVPPIPNKGGLQRRYRLGEVGVSFTPFVNNLWSSDFKALEASVSQMFRLIASYGNVGRNGFNINSVRAWRARAIYMESGRIQDAALFLGNRSLDASVALMGLEWRQSA